jgi:molybdopterin-guanine dinucleotide biosynthesis protein MobB
MTTVPVVHIYGATDSGKTTLVERLLTKLNEKGLQVATIKRSRFEALSMDLEGKDTNRHVAAGSKATAASSRTDAVVFVPGPLRTDAMVNMVMAAAEVDLVIVEGLGDDSRSSAPKIKVGEVKERETGTILELADGDADLTEALRLIDRILKKHRESLSVELRIEGTPVPLKPFVQDYLEGTVRGAVGALKRSGDPDDEIVLRLPRRKRE